MHFTRETFDENAAIDDWIEIFDVARSQKGSFAALVVKSSQISFKIFQKPMWFYLLLTKDSFMEN